MTREEQEEKERELYEYVAFITEGPDGLCFKVTQVNKGAPNVHGYHPIYARGTKEEVQRYADEENLKRGWRAEDFWTDRGTAWEL